MTASAQLERLRGTDPVLRTGRVRRILPTSLEADGPSVPLGTLCQVEADGSRGRSSFAATVVRVDSDRVVLTSLSQNVPTFLGAMVKAHAERSDRVPVGEAFLGRAVDPMGEPLDGMPPPAKKHFTRLSGEWLAALERTSPADAVTTGVRAIDGLLTLGRGQRVGVFAASGVGKTTLTTQIVRQVNVDIAIICLVGERGREVEAFWSQGLDAQARARTTLVAATSDLSAAMRVRAGDYALALAEYWRGQGKHVLLVLDSVTRLAMAMREIGLAAGEPPTVRAYTPGVFAAIPRIVERCGAAASGGAITAIMTVLSESDEIDDPVCEMMKSLLDGHILLSRSLAEEGHFPPIDVLRSVSRQADGLVQPDHRRAMLQLAEWLSARERARTLVDTGLYAKGSNAEIDRALEAHPEILAFLRQDKSQSASADETMRALARIVRARP